MNGAFEGRCPVCDHQDRFSLSGRPIQAPRDFRCPACRSTVVYQAEAAAILDEYEQGRRFCLDQLVAHPDFATLDVVHIGTSGPIRDRLSKMPRYQETAFDPAQKFGQELASAPRRTNQDHQSLTFADASFDLLFSSHVLEHVPDWRRAFAEAFRVLRPRGRYVFSVPVRRWAKESVVRAAIVDGEVVHHHEPRHHNSPGGEPVLVFTDFGRDLLVHLDDVGFVAGIRRPHRLIGSADANTVVVAVRP